MIQSREMEWKGMYGLDPGSGSCARIWIQQNGKSDPYTEYGSIRNYKDPLHCCVYLRAASKEKYAMQMLNKKEVVLTSQLVFPCPISAEDSALDF